MQIFIRYAAYTDHLPNRFLTKAYDARLLFIVSGRGEMHFIDRVEPFQANTLLYYPAGTAYLPLPDAEDTPRFVTVNFDFDRRCTHLAGTMSPVAAERFDETAAIGSHLECGHMLYQKPFVLHHMGDLREAFLEIAHMREQVDAAAHETAEALLQYVLCRLSARQQQEKDGLYSRILEYIALHYATIRNNNEIAAALSYHPYYINQFFKSKSGKTLHRYIRELRLQKAAGMLRGGEQSVGEIAHAVGFSNADHFSKCFMQQYHVTPTRFRRETSLI